MDFENRRTTRRLGTHLRSRGRDMHRNRGGADVALCICAQEESRPVAAFEIDQSTLDGKELSFNVIRQGH